MPRRDRHGNELPPRLYHKGRTYYRVTAEGSRRIWTPIGQDYGTALRRWATLEGGVVHAETLAEVWQAYSGDGEGLLRLAPETRRAYRKAWGALEPVFGHERLERIQPAEVAEYRRRRSALGALRHELSLVGILYRYAREQGWWASVEAPSDGIRRPAKKPRRRVASADEIAALLLAATPLWQRIIEFGLLTGARSGEMRELRRDAITAAGVVLRRPKTRTESLIRWSDALRATVDGAVALQRVPTLWVFPSAVTRQPYAYGGWVTAWRTLCGKAGVQGLRFHDLRRTAATAASDLEHARRLLGHSTQAMTGRVYRVRDEVDPVR